MNRPLKFRSWNKKEKQFIYAVLGSWYFDVTHHPDGKIHGDESGVELEDSKNDLVGWKQFSGLKDKNGLGQEVYECDIISANGTIKGNIYEMEPEETDLVIAAMGTKAWRSTEQEAIKRGLNYAF